MTEKKRKKKKKQKQVVLLKPKKAESQKFLKLLEVLAELEKDVDIQICPHCKSPRVRRVRSMDGDMSGHIGVLPVKYECPDCGWRERLVVKATNRKLGIKEIAIIAEASNIKK